jgi:rSAM/selenodomain-associated transferase 1
LNSALIIFIKNPIKGQVKTRLGRAIGDDEALRIYLELCKATEVAVFDFSGMKYLFYSDEIIQDDDWNSIHYMKRKQVGNNLGERMSQAFESTFKLHDQIILIGSDCPYLKNDHLLAALTALRNVDCVIGPAKDGGYYLLGLRTMIPELFIDKNWSSQTVLAETLNTLNALDHSYQLIETLEDIDTIADWKRYQNSLLFGSRNDGIKE